MDLENNVYIQRMRDKEIKNLSDKELLRVFYDCALPYTCIGEVRQLIKNGLTIEQIWNKPETLASIVKKISELEEQQDKIYQQKHDLIIEALRNFGVLAFAQAEIDYKRR